MNFDNKEVLLILLVILNDKLFLIDWNIYLKKENNYVFQDFGKVFYNLLKDVVDLFKRYKSIYFVYLDYMNYLKEILDNFRKFCVDFDFKNEIIIDLKKFDIEKGIVYISISDWILGYFLE